MRMLWELILFLCWSSSRINTTFVIFFLGGKFHPIKSAHVWLTFKFLFFVKLNLMTLKSCRNCFIWLTQNPFITELSTWIFFDLLFFWPLFPFLRLSVLPSVHPSVCPSRNIFQELYIICTVHICKMKISPGVFSFLQNFDFLCC